MKLIPLSQTRKLGQVIHHSFQNNLFSKFELQLTCNFIASLGLQSTYDLPCLGYGNFLETRHGLIKTSSRFEEFGCTRAS
jgi:hypothetical protein